MSEGKGERNRVLRRTSLKMGFLSLFSRICYGNITEVIFALDLICLALRGGQTSVVDEGKGKISNLVLFLVVLFFHTHTCRSNHDTSLAWW
jgi:hypothetical protein